MKRREGGRDRGLVTLECEEPRVGLVPAGANEPGIAQTDRDDSGSWFSLTQPKWLG